MCGSYTLLNDFEHQEIQSILQEISAKYPHQTVRTGDIYPGQTVPVLIGQPEGIRPAPLTWGFPGFHGSRLIFNARAETALEKKTFRGSLLEQRCAVPCAGFYEWTPRKQRVLFTFPTPVFYMAGIYKEIDASLRFVILTTAANASVQTVHHRMPVLFSSGQVSDWIMDSPSALDYLHRPMPEPDAHFF